jgi:hypothetical protein
MFLLEELDEVITLPIGLLLRFDELYAELMDGFFELLDFSV